MDSVEDSSASAEQPADSPQGQGSDLLRCAKCDKTFDGDNGDRCSECGGELVPDTDSGPKKALLVNTLKATNPRDDRKAEPTSSIMKDSPLIPFQLQIPHLYPSPLNLMVA